MRGIMFPPLQGFGYLPQLARSGIPNWVVARYGSVGIPNIAADFVNDRYWVSGIGSVSLTQLLSVTRASPETATDSSGNVFSFANNVAARTNLGLGVWEGRTNSVPTSDMTGAVAIDNALTNGFFNSPSGAGSGWTPFVGGSGSVTFTTGQVSIVGDGTNNSGIDQQFTTVNGQVYELNYTLAPGSMNVSVGTTQGGTQYGTPGTSTGQNIFRFTATGTTAWLRFYRSVNAVNAAISAVSVQAELVTNGDFASNPINASQNTTSNGWQWNAGGTSAPTYNSGAQNVTLTSDAGGDAVNFNTILFATVVGVTYTIHLDATLSGGAFTMRAGTSIGGNQLLNSTGNTSGTNKQFQFTATTTTSGISIVFGAASQTMLIDNVSVQSAGKLPNNWTSFPVPGTIRTVVGVGTDSGFTTIDVRDSGTPTASSQALMGVASNGSIAMSVGQVWTLSGYERLVGGSYTNVTSPVFSAQAQNSGGTFTESFITTNAVATSAALGTQRFSATNALAVITSAFNRGPFYAYNTTNGSAIDITLRLAAPQLELNPSTQALTAPTTAGGSPGTPGTLPTTSGNSWSDNYVAAGIPTRTLAFATHGGQSVMDATYSGAVTNPPGLFVLPNPDGFTGPAVSPGEQVVASVYYQTVTDDAHITSVALEMLFLNGSNVQQGSTASVSINKATGSVTQYSVSATAPANTTKAIIRLNHATAAGSYTLAYEAYIGPWSLTPNRGMATPWISTTSGAVARVVDVISVNSTFVPQFGASNTGYYAGTPASPIAYSNFQAGLELDDNSLNNRTSVSRAASSGQPFAVYRSAGSVVFNTTVTGGPWAQNVAGKTAFAYAVSDQAASFNGNSVTTNNSALVISGLNTIHVGTDTGASPWNGPITEFAVWATRRLANSALQVLTT